MTKSMDDAPAELDRFMVDEELDRLLVNQFFEYLEYLAADADADVVAAIYRDAVNATAWEQELANTVFQFIANGGELADSDLQALPQVVFSLLWLMRTMATRVLQ